MDTFRADPGAGKNALASALFRRERKTLIAVLGGAALFAAGELFEAAGLGAGEAGVCRVVGVVIFVVAVGGRRDGGFGDGGAGLGARVRGRGRAAEFGLLGDG